MAKTMTHRLTAATAALMLTFAAAHEASAASWRINTNASRNAHFLDINAAMSSDKVQAGDTLYLDPGCLITTNQNVTKQVTIIGTGYFLNGNAHQEATIKGALYLKADGIKMEGVNVADDTFTRIVANNVTIERCHLWDVWWDGKGQYATFRQCFVTGRIVGKGTTDVNSAYCTIENCIMTYTWHGSYSTVSDFYFLTLRNNYMTCYNKNSGNMISNLTNAVITNNIILQAYKPDNILSNLSSSLLTNNVLSCAEGTLTAYPDNLRLGTNDPATVFALEGTNDQQYQLKTDSPAKGYAADGGDCGPTGGAYPYVCSGFPFGMPHFESSSADTRPQDGKVSITQKVTIQEQ